MEQGNNPEKKNKKSRFSFASVILAVPFIMVALVIIWMVTTPKSTEIPETTVPEVSTPVESDTILVP